MENNKPNTEFTEYINSLIEDVIINGQAYDMHKKWLQKYCKEADVEYGLIEENYDDLIELLAEYKNSKSKTIEKFIFKTANQLYLSEETLNKLISANIEKQKSVTSVPNKRLGLEQLLQEKEGNAIIWDNEKFGIFIDNRDGQTYKVVKIGNQIWMTEDLRYKTANSKSYARNMPGNGCFYYFEEAKEACPKGWNLPSKQDMNTLINFLGGEEVAGGKLKSIDRWETEPEEDINYEFDYSKNYGNNESGFNAYPIFNNPNYKDDQCHSHTGTWWTGI